MRDHPTVLYDVEVVGVVVGVSVSHTLLPVPCQTAAHLGTQDAHARVGCLRARDEDDGFLVPEKACKTSASDLACRGNRDSHNFEELLLLFSLDALLDLSESS